MAKFLIKFRLGKSVFERAIDPRFYIDDLKEFGKVKVNIIEENIPDPEEEVTDDHKFWADVELETDHSKKDIKELLEFIIEDGVEIEELQENSPKKSKRGRKSKKEEKKELYEEETTKEQESSKKEIPASLLNNYQKEAEEIILHLSEVVNEIIEEGIDSNLINELFRGFHTLKGNTGILLSYGPNKILEAIKNLAHSTEGFLQKVRDENQELSEEQLDILQEIIDRLDDLLLTFKENPDEDVDDSDIEELVNSLIKGEAKSTSTTKSNKLENVPPEIEGFIKIIDQYIPMYNELKNKDSFSDEEIDFIQRSAIAILSYSEKLKLDSISSKIKELNTALLNMENEKIKIYLGDIANSLNSYKNQIIETYSPKKSKSSDKKHDLSRYISKSNYLKIEESVVKNIMDILGEVSVFKEWLNFFIIKLQKEYQNIEAGKELKDKYQRFKSLVDNLQNIILEMRMIPLTTLFERFPKLVRDLSKQLNKKVKFVVEGADTKLDKVIVEKIGEPMIHLIRNAIDHGIETPEERIKIGKSEEGTLKIKSYQNAGNVIIEVSDDGRGIDPEKVKQKALEKGLKTKEELDKMAEEEIINLIFLPGFSTKDQATEISGRGVGTDAVLAAVTEFGGNIYVESQINVGTTFRLVLPLTLAIQKILLTKVGQLSIGIPAENISEIVKVSKNEITKFNDLNVIHHRDKVIEVIYTNEILQIKSNTNENEDITLLIDNYREKALVVDKVISTIDSVVKPVPDAISDIKELSGITILGDGSIVYIIDVL